MWVLTWLHKDHVDIGQVLPLEEGVKDLCIDGVSSSMSLRGSDRRIYPFDGESGGDGCRTPPSLTLT